MNGLLKDILSGELLTRQMTGVQTLHVGFVDAFSDSPIATMFVIGVVLAVASIFCRYVIYLAVRVTGRYHYDARARALENLWLLFAIGGGFISGEVCFQNIWLAALTGGAFAIISVGAVLEALVINEARAKERDVRRGRRPDNVWAP